MLLRVILRRPSIGSVLSNLSLKAAFSVRSRNEPPTLPLRRISTGRDAMNGDASSPAGVPFEDLVIEKLPLTYSSGFGFQFRFFG